MDLDKKPFMSKKFLAFLFSLIVMASILTIALFTQSFGWPMVMFMTVGIFGLCALAIGFILPQAKYDQFVKGVIGIASRKDESDDQSTTDME